MYDPSYNMNGNAPGYPLKPLPLKVHPAPAMATEGSPYAEGTTPALPHYGLLGHSTNNIPEYVTSPQYVASENHFPLVQNQLESKMEAHLENENLWNQFDEIGTEMIISKSGRRMFPCLNISLRDLDPNTKYALYLDMVLVDGFRYKCIKSEWIKAGTAEPHLGHRYYIHPNSYQMGSQLIDRVLSFQRAKLTNNTRDQNGHIILNSQHKYQPRITVISIPDNSCSQRHAQLRYFFFPKTSFMAVTAYQNTKITQLKIDNNPFAKGFRESGHGRIKKKTQGEDASVPEADQNDININYAEQDRQVRDLIDQGYVSSSSTSSESTKSASMSLAEISELSDEELDVGQPPTPFSHPSLFNPSVSNGGSLNQMPNASATEQTIEHKPEEERVNEKPKDDLSLPSPVRDPQVPPHPSLVMPLNPSDRIPVYIPSPSAVPYPYYMPNTPSVSSVNTYSYPLYIPHGGASLLPIPPSPIHPYPFAYPLPPPK